jgi:hypothetical protein
VFWSPGRGIWTPPVAALGTIMPASADIRREVTVAQGGPVSTGLILWLKSNTDVYQDTAFTSPAVVDGQSVLGWKDQSGAAHHMTQASVSFAPTWRPNQINGFPSVRFDGVDDFLQSLFALDIPFDIFLFVKQITWTAEDSLACGGTGDNYSLLQHGTTPQLYMWNGTVLGPVGGNGSLALATWGVVESGMPSGTNCYIRINSGAATTSGAPASSARGGITLAAHPGPSNFGNVEFAEVMLYNSILSAGQATSNLAYFTGKYGVP